MNKTMKPTTAEVDRLVEKLKKQIRPNGEPDVTSKPPPEINQKAANSNAVRKQVSR